MADVLLGVVRVSVLEVLMRGLLVGLLILVKNPLLRGESVGASFKCSAVDDATSSEEVLDLVKELCCLGGNFVMEDSILTNGFGREGTLVVEETVSGTVVVVLEERMLGLLRDPKRFSLGLFSFSSNDASVTEGRVAVEVGGFLSVA